MDKSIVIVGAGLSGYSAAARLIEKGFTNVTILEAENRIGGRINSINYADGKIDLGAQWCHGERDNVIYQLASKTFKFGTTPFDEVDQIFLLSNGSPPDQKTFRRLVSLAFEILDDENGEMENFEDSLGAFVLMKLKESLKKPEYRKIDAKSIEIFKEYFEREVNGFHASTSWHDISAMLDSQFSEASGNQHLTWKKSGFVKVFDYIAKKNTSRPIDVESKIQLNKKVTKIDYSGVKVQVTTADGHEYLADHVIVTASLGVLKKNHKSLFTPSLPQEKIKAIEKNAFGGVGKIFLEFDEPFWPLDGSSFVAYAFLWNEEQMGEVKAANREWLLGITEFFIVDKYPKLLEAFIGGDKVAAFEQISDEKLLYDCVWLLSRFLNKTIPKPKLIARTKWLSNENFLGAYSFASMNAQNSKVGPRDLAKSVKKAANIPVLLFAGEATDFRFPSYAHGAVSSGYRAAGELINFYGSK